MKKNFGRLLRFNRRHDYAHGAAREQGSAAAHAVAQPGWGSGRLWLILLLCLVGSTAASFVVFKYIVVPIPPELVGTWQVTGGVLHGATLEFRRDGTAVATMYKNGKKAVTNSSVKVDGQTMFLTTRDEKTGKDETVTQAIVELTADALVIRDEDLITYHMKRASH